MGFKKWMILVSSYVFILNLQSTVFAEKNKLIYCLVDDTLSHEMKSSASCPLLVDSNNHQVECIVTIDRVTCLRYLINDEVDFIIAEPEDLMILGTSQNYNNKILVTHELGSMNSGQLSKKMVVIVRKNIEDIFHTEQKRFCSPGFEPGVLTRDYVKYFENRITSRKCDPEKSLLENRMASLSQYFKSACISGPWTIDYQYDQKLKTAYANLCAQCGNSTICSNKDQFFGKWGALRCLTSGKGDVTWATLDIVRQHLVKQQDKDEYSFLCPDGKTKSLTDDPCIWLEEPKKTIAVRMSVADKLGKFIKNPENMNDVWRLFVGMPSSIELPATPIDYLQRSYPEYYSLKDYAKCTPDRSIKWCVTTSLEAEKCKWLSFAAQSHGLEPLIKCVQETSRQKCIESVKTGTTDIFAAQSHEKVEAKKKGLKTIAHMITNTNNEDITVALVRKFSNFTSLHDLKNHKACFPAYKNYEWNSFIYMMRKLTGDNDWYLKDKEMVSKFFSESCVADLHKRNGSEKDFPKNLYSLCSISTLTKRSLLSESEHQNISRQPRNPTTIVEKFEMSKKEEIQNADQAMFNCLTHNNADVAFVNLSSLMKIYPDLIGTVFKVICLNESTTDSDNIEHCYSAKKSLGSLIVNGNVTDARKDEIYLMLVDIDRLFGITYQFVSKLISLYGPFNGSSGIIFPEGTQYLDSKDCGSPCKLNYNDILNDISAHFQSPNRANSLLKEVYFAMILVLFCILLISFKIL